MQASDKKTPGSSPGVLLFFLTLPLVGRVDSEAVRVGVVAEQDYPSPGALRAPPSPPRGEGKEESDERLNAALDSGFAGFSPRPGMTVITS